MRKLRLGPWMENLHIQDDETSQVIPLDLSAPFAWAQRELIKEIERQHNLNQPVRIIVLKGRQLGISTATEGVLFNWNFIYPGTRSLVIAHETDASHHLFGMMKLMWEEWPFRDAYTEKHNSQRSLGWVETRSAISVATARNVGSGRSFTFHAVHCSEVAFWEDPETLFTGLNQSIPYRPGTVVVYESTANGVGNWFHKEWIRATTGQSRTVAMFFPWFKHRFYAFENTTLNYNDMKKEERDLMRQFDLTVPQMAWRRFKIEENQGDVNQFHQEYPCTPEEAFISTGTNIFPLNSIEESYQKLPGHRGHLYMNNGKIAFKRDPTGPWTIFKEPGDLPWCRYVVAGDPSRTAYGDGACIQILNRRTFEQVAVYHGHIDPIPFGQQIAYAGYYYNNACVNVEINGPGLATLTYLTHVVDYPDVWRWRRFDTAPGKVAQTFGWEMSYKRKHMAAGLLTNMLCQRDMMVIHDVLTYEELKGYVTLDNGEMGPAGSMENDDTVTSLMIAVATIVYNDQLSYEDPEPSYNDIGGQTMEQAFR